MESTQEHTSKIAPESQVPRENRRRASFFPADISLRLLLFACSLTGIILLVTSKETKTVPVQILPGRIIQVENTAKFTHSPSFIYLLVALSVTCLYSIVSALASVASKKYHSNKLLFSFILIDLLMLGIAATATGSSGSIAYTGLKGNKYARWEKVCNVYKTYCRHAGGAVALSLINSIGLVLLVILSAYTLYRRSS